MALHELPWPRGVLDGLGEVQVGLRITLSYFIEPNPSRRGWKSRPSLGRSSLGVRYSLIVSIETPESDVDIYTPVSTMIAAAAEIRGSA